MKFGITHSSLWEASTLYYRNMVDSNPVFSYLKDSAMLKSPIASSMLYENRQSIMIGSGGIGKTTALLAIWKNGIQTYNPKEAIPVYIPLYNYKNGTIPYIKGVLLEKLKFDESISTVNDAIHALSRLLDTPIESKTDTKPSILLLLDGLNEVSGQIRSLLVEIEELSKIMGVSILLTSRVNIAASSFIPIYLCL